MKVNMKTMKYIFSAFVLTVGMLFTSCVGDLNVEPIDPSLNTSNNALKTPEDFEAFLAQCYVGFATSGSYGPNGNNNISGLDGGQSQYLRGLYHLNGLTTDEAVCGWNDQTIKDLHYHKWATTDTFIAAFYYRVFYQIAMFNEFLRQTAATAVEVPNMDVYKAEVRTLRAYCWLHAIDHFGNVPFADETAQIGKDIPKRILRADLFNYIETELKDIIENSAISAPGTAPYGRVDKTAAQMILARLYLNAEVYTGTPRYEDCARVCKAIATDGHYSLHTEKHGDAADISAFQELFLADNHKCTDEIVWSIQQNAGQTESYGVTNYIVFASTGGSMDTNVTGAGISSGWGGLRTTPEFYRLFSDSDKRKLFHTDGHNESIDDITEFTHGYAFVKFRNIESDGKTVPGASFDEKKQSWSMPGFVSIDFPMLRYAEVHLMLAECALHEGVTSVTRSEGLAELNKVRDRAGLSPLSDGYYNLDEVLAECGREFAQECHRRSDLIRHNKFTENMTWQWKGEVKNGKETSAHLNLFPIPESDKNANSNLKQNDGY